jgi:hypothetical protein
MKFLAITPVLPSADIGRDVRFYEEKAGFTTVFFDKMYAVLHRGPVFVHLQWHADTSEDPLLGGSVVRIAVEKIGPVFEEFVQKGTVSADKLRTDTPWQTHEFGFYDPNGNAIFIMEDLIT